VFAFPTEAAEYLKQVAFRGLSRRLTVERIQFQKREFRATYQSGAIDE